MNPVCTPLPLKGSNHALENIIKLSATLIHLNNSECHYPLLFPCSTLDIIIKPAR